MKNKKSQKLLLTFALAFAFAFSATGQPLIRWEQIKPISAQLEKTVIVGNDLLLIEDSQAAGLRKYVKISSLLAIDTFRIASNVLELSISGDGVPKKSVSLTPYLDNTDAQTMVLDSVPGQIGLTLTNGNRVHFNVGATGDWINSYKFLNGIVTDRNINVTLTSYTPADYDLLTILADSDIAEGDTITISVNGGTQYNVFDKISYSDTLAITVMFLNDVFYLWQSTGEESVLTGTNTGDQFANNGLSISGDTIQLGGLLTKDTTIIGEIKSDYEKQLYSEILRHDSLQSIVNYVAVPTNTGYGLFGQNSLYVSKSESVADGAVFDNSVYAEDSTGNGGNSTIGGVVSVVNNLVAVTDLTSQVNSFGNTNSLLFRISDTEDYIKFFRSDGTNQIEIYVPDNYVGVTSQYMPISVNGAYADSAGNISVTASDVGVCSQAVQTLTGATDTLNVSNGVNGYLDISGNTTIRIEPTANCNIGNITVLCEAAADSITFTSAYTLKVSPYLDKANGKVPVTNGADAIDCFSYYFDGARIIINGTKNYE